MADLFSGATTAAAGRRAITPERELGAYEALWSWPGAGFKSIAQDFLRHPGAIPSDFVPKADIEKYSRLALDAIRAAGITEFGVRVHGAGEYPRKLDDAEHPVELLYYQGTWELTSKPSVAIVGTRSPSDDGVRRAARLARLCVADGLTVVSGLARGIDTAVHTSAIREGGSTIAVLGTPITESYPPENRDLQMRIADGHLVISQVPIIRYAHQDIRAKKLYFPERNAIMSALTDATIIVEAGDTSGALIQARHAVKQGRKLFILDSCLRNSALSWPAKFLDRGAIRISNYDDIREHLAACHSTANAPDR
jgi:DNA processing protein